jgi:hypothetical protein
MLQALNAAAGTMNRRIQLVDMDYGDAVDALIAGTIDVAVVASQLYGSLLRRAVFHQGWQGEEHVYRD